MLQLLDEPYLRPEALSNLKFYKYSAVDKSLLYNHVLKNWSELAVKAFPMWMAPNLITLAGFGFITINVALLALFIPDLITPGPSWVYLSFAIGLFLYQTLDNVDGRQARRTGTSSALGHIFDHTIDSLNCAPGGLIQVASLGIGPSQKGLSLLLVACAAMCTWEEYHTGTLYLGYFNGPSEAVLIACTIHAISAFFGPQIWLRPLKSVVALRWIPPQWHLYDVVVVAAWFSLFVIHIPECLLNVYKSRRTSSLSFLPTLTQHVPLLIFLGVAISWPLSQSSIILRPHDRSLAFVEYAVLITFSFGKLGPRVILARLTRSPFPWFNFGAFVPLSVGAVYVVVSGPLNIITYREAIERLILHGAVFTSAFSFLYWAKELIHGFTTTLNIGCFTIKRPKHGTITPI